MNCKENNKNKTNNSHMMTKNNNKNGCLQYMEKEAQVRDFCLMKSTGKC